MRYRTVWIAKHYLGTFYSWGGDDPDGFDCSGFVIECLKSVGILPRKFDTTAAGLFNMFSKTTIPEEGVLAFWGDEVGNVRHVEMCIDDRLCIGASGGNSKTITKADAIRDNAFVKIRPIARERPFIGFADPFKMEG